MKIMDEKNYVVYCHINKINNKKYFGITSNYNKRVGKNGSGYKGQYFYENGIKIYGWENFAHIILHKNLSIDEASEYEKKYIKEYNTTDYRYGYNRTSGGSANKPYATGYPVVCLETGEIFNSASDAANKKNINRGHLSNICSGNPTHIGHRAGGYHWEYYKEGIDYTKNEWYKKDRVIKDNTPKMVICLETLEIFNSLYAAAKKYSKNKNNTSTVRGAIKNKSLAFGYHWDFYDENINYSTNIYAGKPRSTIDRTVKKVMDLDTGIIYNSQSECARALNISRDAVRSIITKGRKNQQQPNLKLYTGVLINSEQKK